MFQNVSFTFLCALAFISWSMLCYLHAVGWESQIVINDYNVELYTELPTFRHVPLPCPLNPTQDPYISFGNESLKSYGLVLAATAALCKFLQWLELRTRSFLQQLSGERVEQPTNQSTALPFESLQNTSEWFEERKTENKAPNSTPCVQENDQLREQLSDLQARCRELLQELRANQGISSNNVTELGCNASNSSFSVSSALSIDSFQAENDDVILWKHPATMKSSGISVAQGYEEQGNVKNVYITHSHIHFNFNGSVYLKEQNLNIGLIRLNNTRKQSEFLQVWSTFIKGPNTRPLLAGTNNFLM